MAEQFSVFSNRGAGDTKPQLREFYEQYGWENFLAAIAETKIFDLPGGGMDSVECAKIAKAYKVLSYASQKKEYSLAEYEAYKI